MGYISLPSNMEIQTGRVRQIALQQLSASRTYSREIVGDRVVFQQGGLSDGFGRESYARVIIRTHIGQRNQYPMLNSRQRLSNTELTDYGRSFQSALGRDSRIRLTNWYGVENVMLNNRYNGIKISYSRQTLNNPPVFTVIYEINNNDRQHVLSFSFREAHSQYWEPVILEVIESIVINPIRADNINPRPLNNGVGTNTDLSRNIHNQASYSTNRLNNTQADVIPDVPITEQEGRATLDYGGFAMLGRYQPEDIKYIADRENADAKLYPLEHYLEHEEFQHIDRDMLTEAYAELENEYRLFLAGEYDDKESSVQYTGLPEASSLMVNLGYETKPPSPGHMFRTSPDIMHMPGHPEGIELIHEEQQGSNKNNIWAYVIIIAMVVLLIDYIRNTILLNH